MTPLAPITPTPTKTVATGAKELTVKARQVAGRPGKSLRVEIVAPVARQPSQPQGIEVKALAAEQRTNRRAARLWRPSSRASRRSLMSRSYRASWRAGNRAPRLTPF